MTSSDPQGPKGRAFAHVDTWVFDLDNTLYPSSCNLFAQIEQRMGAFIAERLGLSPEDAHALRRRFYHEHGTTLSGLMKVHHIAPADFLDFVHDIDLTPVDPNHALDASLAALPGRKVIFTNGSARHAENIIEKVGIAHHFEAIFDIAAANYVPKPARETYDALIAATGCKPSRAVMFDDISRNLVVARDLGMTTVWIRTDEDWSSGGAVTHAHVDHIAEDLTGFLNEIVTQNFKG